MALHRPRLSRLLLALSVLLFSGHLLGRATKAQDVPEKPEAKKDATDEKAIRALITQLGDDSFDKREAAVKQLKTIGDPALNQLEKAATDAKDPEVRVRAEQLMLAIMSGQFFQVRQFDGRPNGKKPSVTRVAVTPDGKRVVALGGDALRCWDLASAKQVVAFDERKGPLCWGLAISADGTTVIAGCSGAQAHVFDLATGKKVKVLIGHKGPVWGVALSPDGKVALTGGSDRTIRVWDTASGKQSRVFEGAPDEVRCLAWSPDGKLVATGHFAGDNEPGIIRIWDFELGRQIRAISGHKEAITSVSFSPDGKSLLSASWDKAVGLWDVATGKLKKFLGAHTNRVEYAVFAANGKWIVSCGNAYNPSLRLWDVASGRQLAESEEVPEGFFGIAASPDGRQFVSGGRDGVVRLWQWKR